MVNFRFDNENKRIHLLVHDAKVDQNIFHELQRHTNHRIITKSNKLNQSRKIVCFFQRTESSPFRQTRQRLQSRHCHRIVLIFSTNFSEYFKQDGCPWKDNDHDTDRLMKTKSNLNFHILHNESYLQEFHEHFYLHHPYRNCKYPWAWRFSNRKIQSIRSNTKKTNLFLIICRRWETPFRWGTGVAVGR